jgi:hypothetical protein
MRADLVEQALLVRITERASHHRGELDKNLARLIRNELVDAENKRRR